MKGLRGWMKERPVMGRGLRGGLGGSGEQGWDERSVSRGCRGNSGSAGRGAATAALPVTPRGPRAAVTASSKRVRHRAREKVGRDSGQSRGAAAAQGWGDTAATARQAPVAPAGTRGRALLTAPEVQRGRQCSASRVPSGIWGGVFGSDVTQPFLVLQEQSPTPRFPIKIFGNAQFPRLEVPTPLLWRFSPKPWGAAPPTPSCHGSKSSAGDVFLKIPNERGPEHPGMLQQQTQNGPSAPCLAPSQCMGIFPANPG